MEMVGYHTALGEARNVELAATLDLTLVNAIALE